MPGDAQPKHNVHKAFTGGPASHMNILCIFHLSHVAIECGYLLIADRFILLFFLALLVPILRQMKKVVTVSQF